MISPTKIQQKRLKYLLHNRTPSWVLPKQVKWESLPHKKSTFKRRHSVLPPRSAYPLIKIKVCLIGISILIRWILQISISRIWSLFFKQMKTKCFLWGRLSNKLVIKNLLRTKKLHQSSNWVNVRPVRFYGLSLLAPSIIARKNLNIKNLIFKEITSLQVIKNQLMLPHIACWACHQIRNFNWFHPIKKTCNMKSKKI